MNERGSIGATITIVIVIILGVAGLCYAPLANTAKQADNISQVSLQSSLTNFVNEECNKGGVYEEDFDKLVEEVTGPNATYNLELEIHVKGDSEGKKKSQAVSDKTGENGETIYYMSQIQEIWDNNGGVFKIDEGAQVYAYAENTNTTMGTELTSPTSSDISNIKAEATATCNK